MCIGQDESAHLSNYHAAVKRRTNLLTLPGSSYLVNISSEYNGTMQHNGGQQDPSQASASNGAGPSQPKMSATAPLPANDVSYQSMDSEELSALEEMAEGESESDTEIDRLLDEAADAFPPEIVSLMIKDLKQHGIFTFLQRYVLPDPTPLRIKHLLLALGVFLPRSIRDSDETSLDLLLPILKTTLARILRRREKLPQYNTITDALDLLQRSNRIMILSGAGISVPAASLIFAPKTESTLPSNPKANTRSTIHKTCLISTTSSPTPPCFTPLRIGSSHRTLCRAQRIGSSSSSRRRANCCGITVKTLTRWNR